MYFTQRDQTLRYKKYNAVGKTYPGWNWKHLKEMNYIKTTEKAIYQMSVELNRTEEEEETLSSYDSYVS